MPLGSRRAKLNGDSDCHFPPEIRQRETKIWSKRVDTVGEYAQDGGSTPPASTNCAVDRAAEVPACKAGEVGSTPTPRSRFEVAMADITQIPWKQVDHCWLPPHNTYHRYGEEGGHRWSCFSCFQFPYSVYWRVLTDRTFEARMKCVCCGESRQREFKAPKLQKSVVIRCLACEEPLLRFSGYASPVEPWKMEVPEDHLQYAQRL